MSPPTLGRNPAWLSLVAAACTVFMCIAMPTATWSKSDKDNISGIVFHQKSGAYGKLDVYLTPTNLRVDFLDYGCGPYLISNAPSWDVVLYNPKSKKGRSFTLEQWRLHGIKMTYLFESNPYDHKFSLRDCGETTVCGLKARNVQWIDDQHAPPRSQTLIKYQGSETTPSASLVMDKLIFTPWSDGFALVHKFPPRNLRKSLLGSMEASLETTAVERKLLPTSLFRYPKSFTSTQHEFQILANPDDQKANEQALRELTAP